MVAALCAPQVSLAAAPEPADVASSSREIISTYGEKASKESPHAKVEKAVVEKTGACSRPAGSADDYNKEFRRLFETWTPILIGILFLVFLFIRARKQNKKVWANQATMMERQAHAIKVMEGGITIQREQTQLLKDILAALQKRT